MSVRVLHWLRAQLDTDTWRNTDAMYRAVVVGVGLVAAGVLAHSLEMVLIGAPLLISLVLAARSPTGEPVVHPPAMPRATESGQHTEAVFDIEASPGVELVALRAPYGRKRGIGHVHLLPGTVQEVRTELAHAGWGEGVDLRPDRLFTGPDALRVYGPIVGREGRRTVLPPVVPLPAGPLPPRPAGLVGVHRSPRPGDSTELRDIRVFQPGDRLRRIDWRVSLRAAASNGGVLAPNLLHVRERHAEADATLVIALDTQVDVGAELADWALAVPGSGVREGGSLDIAVRAASSLAASYLRQGDRVGLVDMGRPQLSVPPGSGSRQLLKIRHQLVICSRSAGWAPRPVLRPQQAPPGALVIVLSPFLDDAMVDLTATVVRRGTRVLAMDLLPDPLVAVAKDPWGEVVLKVLRTEHEMRLETLRQHGIPVLKWGDEASATLRGLARGRR
ncbi:uncharacterized protein (DUF58 family) [Kibdelosporangium banguiense]|uniref:Uncharacterized protein (DUF58 family) n=1 Tax=Kibdelosporangium banguiense TaxID=1365924 RepID=A0ABS4T917_9PSEU|nr:DUF58 domain-containing protein [Kibdelosporangium banguiense]MBP2320909.1 uncharacterized protein (DUF58 family) [Kibdelosporangium banguiense]